MTFLVVPILVVESIGPVDALKRSGHLLKSTWGEQIAGNISIGLVFGLITIGVAIAGVIGVVVLFMLNVALGIVGIVLLVAAIIVIAVLGSTLSGIFTIALYRYATGAGPNSFFSQDTLQSAFRTK